MAVGAMEDQAANVTVTLQTDSFRSSGAPQSMSLEGCIPWQMRDFAALADGDRY